MQSDMCYIGEMVRKLCERQEILGSIFDECKKKIHITEHFGPGCSNRDTSQLFLALHSQIGM